MRVTRRQLACSSALSSMRPAFHGTASMVPRHRVASEQHVVGPRQLQRLDHAAVGQGHLGARRDVAARLDHAVVAEGDADPGVGAEQAALTDGDHLGTATREGAHDRGPASDVGVLPDHDSRGDAALDHRGAEGAGVVVDEALVHDGRTGREVGAQAHPVAVGDAHPRRHHVVDHPRELVDAVDGHPLSGRLEAGPGLLEALDRARPRACPHHVGEQRRTHRP